MNRTDVPRNEVRPVLACLGVDSRFRLVRALARADRCVGELADAVGLSQSCTTRHLQALERVGLVKGRREGRRVRFSLRAETPGLGELLSWALADTGLEELVGGGGLRRNRAAARSAVAPAPPSEPGRPRKALPRRRLRPPDDVAPAPVATPAPGGDDPPRADGRRDLAGDAGLAPAQRPGDLEDYLL